MPFEPITASRTVSHEPERVFAFLSDLRNHWRLEARFIELNFLDDDERGGLVRVKGPFGLGRMVRTNVVRVQSPRTLEGRAELGSRTRAAIRWEIASHPVGARVTLSALIESASPGDRLLLRWGGRLWLREIFRNALANLDRVLAGHSVVARSALDWIDDGLTAGAAAAVAGGLPSTIHALVRGRDPLEATLAAGSILAPRAGRAAQALAAVPVHLTLSLGWGLVLARLLPRRRTLLGGALSGLAIAALDLGVVGRRFDRIHALPTAPQVADHLAYGATVGVVLAYRRGTRP